MKCSYCGAGIKSNSNDRIVKCPYCSCEQKNEDYTERTTMDILNNKIDNLLNNKSSGQEAQNQNHSSYNTSRPIPPRPKANGLITFILLVCYFIPGIIYLIHIGNLQKEWDKKYGK